MPGWPGSRPAVGKGGAINAHPASLQPVPSGAERAWARRASLLVMALTTLPYLLGYLSQGSQWRFTGFILAVEDGNSYIAKMLSGAAGAWLFRSPYTAEPQGGVLAFLPYLLLGKLAAGPALHEQLVALYHLFRFGAGLLALLAAYEFLAVFIGRVELRRAGFWLAALGGGLGWLPILLGVERPWGDFPLEFISPETFGFLAWFALPHLALARAALLAGLVITLRMGASDGPYSWLNAARLGICWLAAGLAQPLAGVLLFYLIGLYQLCRWAGGRREAAFTLRLAAAGAAPLLLAGYTALRFATDPYLAAWTAQNRIFSPHIMHYVLAYGLIAPLAVAGALRLPRRMGAAGWWLALWAASLLALAYLPVNLQRRLPEAGWMALLALGLGALDGRPAGSARPRLGWAGLLPPWLWLAFPSTLVLFLGGMASAARPGLPVFRPAAEVRLFDALAGLAQPGQVVLAGYSTSNALPAWAPLRVIIGHGPESAGLAELQPRVERFYSASQSDAGRRELLAEFGVGWVVYSPQEAALGGWQPAEADWLAPVYAADGWQIFRLQPP